MSIVRPPGLGLVRRNCGLLVFALLWLVGSVALAHPVAQGALEISVFPDRVHVVARVTMEEVLVQNTLSASPGSSNVSPNEMVRLHADYFVDHFRVLADGKALAGRVSNVLPPPRGGVQMATYDFDYTLAARPAQLRLEEDVLNEFNYAPGNRWEATYVVRFIQQEQTTEGLLLTSRSPLVLDCNWNGGAANGSHESATLNKWRLFGDYLRYGILHILTGYDHLLFIAALVLAVATFWDLVKVITAFTLAHSVTLTLSVLDIVRLPGRVVEPMIAASIIFVALQNFFWPSRSRGAARLGVAFFFGLFHGLGFAGGLLDAMSGMAGLTVGLAILAFSLGVEIGHQVVVLPLFGTLKLLRSERVGASRWADFVFRYGSAAIACAGIFYLVVALRS